MTKMNGMGPDGHGPATGRKFGKCIEHSSDDLLSKLGKGLGKRRKAVGESGKGKRLKANNKT